MPTIKILSFFALCWVVFAIMMNLLLQDLAVWWWVPIAGFTFAVLNIAASRVRRVKAEQGNSSWRC